MGQGSTTKQTCMEKWGFPLFATFVFSVLLIVYLGEYSDHRIVHAFPFIHSDTHFLHFATAEATFDQGHYRYLPDYLGMGFEKALPHFAPGVAHLPGIIAYATGIPVFDAVEFAFTLLFLLIAIPFFTLFSRFRPEVQLLAFALLPLLFEKNFVYGIGAAAYGFILGAFLFIGFLLLWYTPQLRSPLFLGISLGGIMIGHPPEIFFATVFLVAFVLWDLLCAHFATARVWYTLKICGITLGIFLLTISAYLVPFAVGPLWGIGGNPLEYHVTSVGPKESNPWIWASLGNFRGSILLFLGLGFFLVLYKPFQQKFALLFFVLLSNLNYFGFLPTLDIRGFQYRFIWPITLSIFFGLGVYTIIGLLAKRWSRWYRGTKISEKGMLLLSLVISIGIFLLLVTQRQFGEGVRNVAITNEQYRAFQWIEQHTEPQAEILFLYIDGRNANHIALKRFHAVVGVEEMERSFTTNFSTLPIRTMIPPETFGPPVIWNNSQFQFIEAQWEQRVGELENRTICDFDYYILDTYSELGERGGNRLIGFNAKFLQRAVEHGVAQMVYQNPRTLIVKNIRRGEPCV